MNKDWQHDLESAAGQARERLRGLRPGGGLHFKLPYGIERVRHVPTARVLKEEFGFRSLAAGQRTRYSPEEFDQESLMLTGDLNGIDVEWIVQYRIADPVRFLFRVREPRETIRDLAEAIMRRTVGTDSDYFRYLKESGTAGRGR